MKQLRGILIFLLSLTTAVLAILLSAHSEEFFGVWAAMLSGREVNLRVFAAEWTVIFLSLLLFWICQFSQAEKTYADMWLGTTFPALTRLFRISPRLPATPSSTFLGEIRSLDEGEAAAFRQLISLEKGPALLDEPDWGKQLKLVTEPYPAVDTDPSGWLVMDLDEAAKEPPAHSPLSRDIDDLIEEQEQQVFGINSLGSRESDGEEGDFPDLPPPRKLKVVYRSAGKGADKVPDTLKKAWESKNDIVFYQKLTDTIDS